MIFFKSKIIFIHIPRTGGSTIENFLWKYEGQNIRSEKNLWMGFTSKYSNQFQTGGLQHLTAEYVREVYPKEMDAFFKFSFVRNPFSRIVSQYLYTINHRKDLQEYLSISNNTSYESYLEKIKNIDHVQWMPSSKFLLDKDNNLNVNFIGKQENFTSDLLKVLKRVGINYDKDFKIENKSQSSIDYKSFYENKGNIKFIEKKYAHDLEYFDYNIEMLSNFS